MRIVTLEYHDLILGGNADTSGFPGPAAASYKLDEEDFARHLEALSARSRVGLDARTLSATLEGRDVPVLLTFDDGGASAMRIAERLEERGWRGHFFMTTDCVGRAGFMSESDLRALHARGHVVGSHSCSHPLRMSRLSPSRIAEEWRESLRVLNAVVGAPVTVASVPGGYFSRTVAELAAAAGVRVLFTSEPTTSASRVGECVVFGRYTIRRGMSASRVVDLVGERHTARAAQWLVWNAKKVAKAAGGNAYLRARELLLGG